MKLLQAVFIVLISLLVVGQSLCKAEPLLLANVVIMGNGQSALEDAQQPASSDLTEQPARVLPQQDSMANETQQQPTTERGPQPSQTTIKSTPIKSEKTLKYSLSKQKNNTVDSRQKPRQFEIQGSLNNKYVYLIVEKTGDKQIAGYLFDGKGKKKYIYGEFVNGALQVYDTGNNKSTILLNEQKAAAEKKNFQNDSRLIGNKELITIRDSHITRSTISNNVRGLSSNNADSISTVISIK